MSEMNNRDIHKKIKKCIKQFIIDHPIELFYIEGIPMSNDLVEIIENLTPTKNRKYIRYAVNSYTLTQALDFEGIPIPVMGNNYIFINNYNKYKWGLHNIIVAMYDSSEQSTLDMSTWNKHRFVNVCSMRQYLYEFKNTN